MRRARYQVIFVGVIRLHVVASRSSPAIIWLKIDGREAQIEHHLPISHIVSFDSMAVRLANVFACSCAVAVLGVVACVILLLHYDLEIISGM